MSKIVKVLDPAKLPDPIECAFGSLYTILLSEQFVPGDKVRIESDVTESVFYCLSKVEPGKK